MEDIHYSNIPISSIQLSTAFSRKCFCAFWIRAAFSKSESDESLTAVFCFFDFKSDRMNTVEIHMYS